jgi:predicted transglutaminase-like cysteine proteinase
VNDATRRIGWVWFGLCLFVAMVFAAGDVVFEARVAREAQQRFGAEAAARTREWFALMRNAEAAPEPEKLQIVNAYFNRVQNADDALAWGSADYWATPLELLGKNAGDCEDLTFAKYFTLRELGVADEKLRVMYVRAYLARPKTLQSHMVLAYYPTPAAEPLVLDSLTDAIRPGRERGDLIPVYEFNGGALWLAKERGAVGRLTRNDTAPQWPALRLRMLRLDMVDKR